MTADRIRARGGVPIALPLFAARPLPWGVPDPTRFDALLVTSANAFRHGGEGLGSLRSLPVLAVGDATATAADGFEVALVGTSDVDDLLARARQQGFRRLLHLAGRDRIDTGGKMVAAVATLYAVDPLPITPERLSTLYDSVALLHSTRASRRLAELLDADRRHVAIAAISPKVLGAASLGWGASAIAPTVSDESLIDAALALAG